MGNFLSSLFNRNQNSISTEEPDNSGTHIKENEIDNCDVIEEKLTKLLKKASETTNEIEMKKIYDEAITYIECNSTEVISLKEEIFKIYQELLYINVERISTEFEEIPINDNMNEKQKFDIYTQNKNNINKIIEKIEKYAPQYTIDDKVNKILTELTNKKNTYDSEISKLNGTIKILQIKKLAGYIYCGYNLSLISSYNKNTAKSTDEILDAINKILDANLTFDSYYYLLQFSELLYLLYPIEDIKEGENSVVDKNILNEYLNIEHKDKSKVYKHLQLLGVYYAKFYYNNPDLDKTNSENEKELSQEYTQRKQQVESYLNTNSTEETLYNDTKKLFKQQSIEHWKGLIQMSRKRLKFNTAINYIPKTLPLFYHKIEQYLAGICISNLIYFNLGSISDKGQYTYFNIQPLKYEEIFSDEAWDRTTKISNTEINTKLEKTKKIYTDSIEFVNKNPELTQAEYDKSEYPLKLTSDKFGTQTDKTIKNNTANITNKFLQKFINQGVIRVPPLGAYKFAKNNYVINYTLIPSILIKLEGDKNIDYFGNCANSFMVNSIDYMCEIYDTKHGNFSEFVSQFYYEMVGGSLNWNMVFPLQTLNINMTINNNDYNNLENKFKTDEEKYDHMIDRSTLFRKSNDNF